MEDHRPVHGNTNGGQQNLRNTSVNNEVDMLVHSESPQIQEFRLYRELSREIEKNNHERVRYTDSELYIRGDGNSNNNPDQSGSVSDIHGVNKNNHFNTISQVGDNKTKTTHQLSVKASNNLTVSSSTSKEMTSQMMKSNGDKDLSTKRQESQRKSHPNNRNCQVCLIKELKDDLIDVTKIIQERNEQLTSKLKSRRLRTFFERQMLD